MKLFELFAVLSLQTAAFEKGMKSAVSIGNNTATKLTTTFQKATNAVERGLKVGAVALGTGFATLTKKALDFTGNLEQNLGGSEAVWGKYAETVQKAAKSAFGMAGLGTAEYLATANKMGSLFMGAGFETEEALDMTMNAMQRAADVAAIMGIDVEWAMESIAGAAKGNFTMMDNLGVAINDTTLAQYALSKGITKSTQAMTGQEKVALAMELFMERTAYAAGQYNRENETLAGSLATAKAAFVNFLDGSGSVDDFVAATVNAGKVVTKNIVEIVPRLFTGLGKAAGEFVPYIEAAWVDIWDNKLPGIVTTGANSVIELINGVFGTNIPKIESIDLPTWEELSVMATEWWLGISEGLSGIMEPIGGIGESLYAIFTDAMPDTSTFTSGVSAAADEVLAFTTDILSWADSILAWIADNEEISALLTAAVGAAAIAIHPLISILSIVVLNWTNIKNLVIEAIEVIGTFFTKTVPAKWNEMVEGIGSWWKEHVTDPIDNTVTAITSFFDSEVSPAFNSMIDTVVGLWNSVSSAIQGAISAIKEFLGLNDGAENVTNSMYGYSYGQAAGGYGLGSDGGATGAYSTYFDPDAPAAKPFGKKIGLDYVPYDGFPALLHEGESVLTKQEAEEWRRSGSNAVSEPVDYDRLVAAFVEAMSRVRVQMDSREVGHMVAPTVSEDIGRNAKKNRFATA